MILSIEKMRDGFEKCHFGGGYAVHYLYAPDIIEPHDHPGSLEVEVVHGGYTEKQFRLDGTYFLVKRKKGDKFIISTETIHKIIDVNEDEGGCITFVKYGPKTKETRFWRWENGIAQSRKWNEEWTITS